MDEEITIIDSNTRNERIKNFFNDNKKNIIISILIILILVIGYFVFDEVKERKKIKLANQFNLVTMDFIGEKKQETVKELTEIIYKNDSTYSPLSLYFLIDNNLIDDNDKINDLFDVLVNKTSLEKEIKNLIIYKKALFNSNFADENELIQILNPIINSDSVWKSHALYLIAEYFYYKNEYQKAKEFFNQIIILSNSNDDIKMQSQKRLSRDLSE